MCIYPNMCLAALFITILQDFGLWFFSYLCANCRNQQMTDSSAITTTLERLSGTIIDMNTHDVSASITSTACTPFPNPYNPSTSFDLSSQSGETTYDDACSPLSKPWDGQVETFPDFIVNVQICANNMKWNTFTPHGILSVSTWGNINYYILTKYQSISSVNIVDAFATCTDDFTIQNSKAYYYMLSKSVTRYIHDTVFEQAQNLLSDKDGIALFTIFTSFTVVASLQISIQSFNQITNLRLLT